MKVFKGIVAVLVLLIVGVWSFVWIEFGVGNTPFVEYTDGRVSRVGNCEFPGEEHWVQCASLYCKKALFDEGTAAPNSTVDVLESSYNFSNDPDKSVHIAKIRGSVNDVYMRCVMTQMTVTKVELVTAEAIGR